MALETVGVRLTVEGANQAVKALDSVDKALASLQKSQGSIGSRTGGASLTAGLDKTIAALRPAQGAISGYSKSLDGLAKAFPQVNQAVQAFGQITGVNVPIIGNAANSLGTLKSAIATIPPPALAAGAAIVGLTAGMAALTALGSRGAALQPTIAAFGNLFGASADTTAILGNLREQTRGTISDMELMRLSVAALQGTSSQFRQTVGQDLGSIIDLTGRIAQASGQSADVVREKFLLGLRRQSKLLLDDVGVVLDASKVYDDYAKSIGTTTSALTDQQKQAAYAAAAIAKLKEIGAEIGTPAKTLEDLKAPFVVLQNVLDKLSIAVLPLFAPFAAGVASIFRAFESGVTTILPIIEIFSQLGGLVVELTGKFLAFTFSISPLGLILNTLGTIVPYVVASFQILRDGVNTLAGVVGPAIASLGAAIRSGLQSILPAFPQFGQDINNSLAGLPYDLAKGGANIIGSFAAGLLQGGTYVVQAVTAIAKIVADFLEGFSPPKKGPLSEIDKGGANVAAAWAGGFLEGFANTAEQAAAYVNDKLGNVASMSLDGIAGRFATLDLALKPFNEQLTIAKGIFEQIAGIADPALKVINRQLEAAIKAKDSQAVQRLDEQAAALKKLKSEQQAQLDQAELSLALAKSQQAQERALLSVQQDRLGKAKEAATGGGGGGGAAEQAATGAEKAGGGGGGAAPAGATETPAPFATGTPPDILSTKAVQEARANIEKAAGQFAAGASAGFAESGFGDALGEFTSGTGELGTQLNRIASAKPGDKIGEQLSGITKKLDPVKQAFTDLQTNIQTAMDSIGTTIGTAFGADGTVTLAFTTLFAEGGLLGTGGPVQLAMASLFGPENPIITGVPLIQGQIANLQTNLESSFNVIQVKLLVAQDAFNTFKTKVDTVIDGITSKVGGLPAGITEGLTSLGSTLQSAMVVPFVNAINGIIGAVNEAFNKVLGEIRSIGGVIAGALGVDVPSIQIPLIQVPGAARGGVGLRGMTLVGEQGPELVNFGSPATVFPNLISELIMGLAAQPAPVYVSNGGGSGGSSNTSNQTINSTFNVGSTEQGRLLERQRAAFLGY